MTLTDDQLMAILLGQLDERERDGGVVYRAVEPVAAGEALELPGVELTPPASALLAFVDREPTANWSHPSRYVLINRETGQARSVDAKLPPFFQQTGHRWVVVHRGASVPEAALPDLH